jgi:ATP-dependent DNA helicase 2 subunit 2
MSNEDLDQITKKIKEDNIELVVLGTDFDDPEYGFKEEGKDPRKVKCYCATRSVLFDR